ncbi:hypothetical protein FVE85_5659 [Porphyridium purpureum]|uniref:Uncharacterized protein n=1 Tax=Porphyridium purpureum TaxID=35688 RepID=A0A5J4Z533_PORPP|nr:hypothetical protein FVE85_5659 [Porphyridium purpureum]|eukprot:POR0385..scf295_1
MGTRPPVMARQVLTSPRVDVMDPVPSRVASAIPLQPSDVLSVSDDEFEPAGALHDDAEDEVEDEEKRKRQLPRGNSAIFFRPLTEKSLENEQVNENGLDAVVVATGLQQTRSPRSDPQSPVEVQRRTSLLNLRESLRANKAALPPPPPSGAVYSSHQDHGAPLEAQEVHRSDSKDAREGGGSSAPLERKSMRDIAFRPFGSSRKPSGMQQQNSAGSKNNLKTYPSAGGESMGSSASRGGSLKLLASEVSTEKSPMRSSRNWSAGKNSQSVSRQISDNSRTTPLGSRQPSGGSSKNLQGFVRRENSHIDEANGAGPADSYDGYLQNSKTKKSMAGWMKKLTNKN